MSYIRVAAALLASLVSVLAATPAKPSVDAILAHFVSALGGQAAIEKITSRFMAGTLEIPGMKATATTTEYFQFPNRFSALTDIPGYGAIRTVYDGKTGWQADPQRGVTEISGPELADLSRRADIHWHMKLHELYPDLKVKGLEKINGKEAWKLVTSLQSWDYALYFDAQSGLLVRFDTDRHTKDGLSSVFLSDYRPVGDSLFSYSTMMSGPGAGWTRTLATVKFNIAIDPTVFLKPNNAP